MTRAISTLRYALQKFRTAHDPVGQIAEMVSGREHGDLPDDPEKPEARRRRVVIEMSADSYAIYKEAQGRLRRDCDRALSEEDGLVLMARAALEGLEMQDAARIRFA